MEIEAQEKLHEIVLYRSGIHFFFEVLLVKIVTLLAYFIIFPPKFLINVALFNVPINHLG